MELWEAFKNSLSYLVFPSKCLHCHDLIPPHSYLLCDACASLLDLIDPSLHCTTCFSIKKNAAAHDCTNCQNNPTLFYQMASAFEYVGPAATLVKKLKYANQPHLARGLAAFLLAQFDQLNWPMPDAFIPVPITFSHWLDRGYNQSKLIAEEMGKMLNIPVWDVLKRKSGDFSQAGLTLAQRKKMDGNSFKIKNRTILKNKTVILIDDVVTSGTTLAKCAETLVEGAPSCLYALTVCKAFE